MSLGGGGMLVPQRQRVLVVTHVGVLTMINVSCFVVVPFVTVVFGIPLLVAYETMYV